MKLERIRPAAFQSLSQSKELEIVAALIVEATTDLTLEPSDPGGGAEQLADFRSRRNSSDDGVVEVTTTTVEERARFGAEVRRLNWQDPALGWHWLVRARESSDPRAISTAIGAHLGRLEERGETDGWLPRDPALEEGEPGTIPRELGDLGVVGLCAWQQGSPGGFFVQAQGPSGPYSFNAVTRAAQSQIDKADNRAKVTTRGHGHLFVWLDVTDAQVALASLVSPPFSQLLDTIEGPQLPPSVSIWLASGLADWPRPATAILRSDGGQWYIVEPPTLALSDRHRAWI